MEQRIETRNIGKKYGNEMVRKEPDFMKSTQKNGKRNPVDMGRYGNGRETEKVGNEFGRVDGKGA